MDPANHLTPQATELMHLLKAAEARAAQWLGLADRGEAARGEHGT